MNHGEPRQNGARSETQILARKGSFLFHFSISLKKQASNTRAPRIFCFAKSNFYMGTFVNGPLSVKKSMMF